MTQTYDPSVDTRDCRLYRFYGWDPRTNYTTKVLIYIGETVREPFERLMEHIDEQPWRDTITSWEVDDRVYAGKAEVLAAEAAAIRRERPLYNVRENMGNPCRVKPWEAEAQRHRRDDVAGKPRWVKVRDREPAPARPARPAPPAKAPTRRRANVRASRRIIVGTLMAAWLLLSMMVWKAVEGHATGGARAWWSALLPVVMLGWGAGFGPGVWRRICRRVRRWFR